MRSLPPKISALTKQAKNEHVLRVFFVIMNQIKLLLKLLYGLALVSDTGY